MNLSNNLVSQFVKITNDREKHTQQQQATLYGTTVIYDDKQYVQIDGSDLLTPAETTVHIKNGERVTVSINNHTALIDGNVTDISASQEHLEKVENDLVDFKITTEGMFVEVRNEMYTQFAKLEVKIDNIHASVKDTVDNAMSSIDIYKDKIESAVSVGDMQTIVTQNATSWGLSINGKLSGTNYNFDGTNFSIGSSSGATRAYHAASYSKWTHSDGSFTQISASGLTWSSKSSGGTTTNYHSLLYAGEYTCASEQTVTITLPDEFKGKNFKVVTSVKRIYVSKEEYATGCYFPLISFYAEALNVNQSAGTFQVYASIRAWNRTGYGGWGQMIGNGAVGTGEREALKPVVAYWAFV